MILDHLHQINKVKKLDRRVRQELYGHQMKKRFDACVSLLSRNKGEPFMHRIVTCDEKWILHDNCIRSARWLDKDEVPKHSSKLNIYQKKLTVTTWWCRHGLIHHCFIQPCLEEFSRNQGLRRDRDKGGSCCCALHCAG